MSHIFLSPSPVNSTSKYSQNFFTSFCFQNHPPSPSCHHSVWQQQPLNQCPGLHSCSPPPNLSLRWQSQSAQIQGRPHGPQALNERGVKEFVAIFLKTATPILKEIGTHCKSLPLAVPLFLVTGLAYIFHKDDLSMVNLQKHQPLCLDLEVINSDQPYTSLLLVIQIAFRNSVNQSEPQFPHLNSGFLFHIISKHLAM